MRFIVCIICNKAVLSVQLRVLSLGNTGQTEKKIEQLRFHIQNYGTEPLENFSCYYYFTTELDKIIVCEDYYAPDTSVSLENLSSGNYCVKFSFIGININEAGCNAVVNGNTYSRESMFLCDRDAVNGNSFAAETRNKKTGDYC